MRSEATQLFTSSTLSRHQQRWQPRLRICDPSHQCSRLLPLRVPLFLISFLSNTTPLNHSLYLQFHNFFIVKYNSAVHHFPNSSKWHNFIGPMCRIFLLCITVLNKFVFCFLKMGHSWPLFLYFVFPIQLQLVDKTLPMLGFEPRISGVGSNRSTN